MNHSLFAQGGSLASLGAIAPAASHLANRLPSAPGSPLSETRNPKPETRNPKPYTLHPELCTLNPEPSTIHPPP